MQARSVTAGITVADQPTAEELSGLPAEGYVGVVNLRHDGEPEQPLSTAEEARQVKAAGLEYLNVPVGAPPLDEPGVAAVCDFLDRHAQGKVLVHCRKGGRAAALVLIHQAQAQRWPADEALDRGEAMGLKVDGKLRAMVAAYLAAHPS